MGCLPTGVGWAALNKPSPSEPTKQIYLTARDQQLCQQLCCDCTYNDKTWFQPTRESAVAKTPPSPAMGDLLYRADLEVPEDLVQVIASSPDKPQTPDHPSFGLDSPTGLLLSSFAAPFYLYATFRGKFELWDEWLSKVPHSTYVQPTLDLGCGRGLVLLKVAECKRKIAVNDVSARVAPAYGIDIFSTSDQTGNSAAATYRNAAAMGLLGHTVLHQASFAEQLPFADGTFSLITASLSLHNTSQEGRRVAIREMARVCAVGGRLIVVDLWGSFNAYTSALRDANWTDVSVRWAGLKMMYGILPCQVLEATKPEP